MLDRRTERACRLAVEQNRCPLGARVQRCAQDHAYALIARVDPQLHLHGSCAGKQLVAKAGGSRRYHVPPHAARTITALLVLRDQVIGPILAGVRSPRLGRKPSSWTRIDRDYEILRVGMQTLFADLGITTDAIAA